MEEEIKVKACLAVVSHHAILLVQRIHSDTLEKYWSLPGGRVFFGDSVDVVALRYFEEETGLKAGVTGFMDVVENIIPNKPYHSLTITLYGTLLDDEAFNRSPADPEKSRWFTQEALKELNIHPEAVIYKALGVA